MSEDIKKLLAESEAVIAGARLAAKVPDDGFWVELEQSFRDRDAKAPKIEPRQVREGR